MEYLKIGEMVIEQIKDDIRKLEIKKKEKIAEFISDLSVAFKFKEGDVLSNNDKDDYGKKIIIAKLKSGYIPIWLYKDVSNADLDAEGIRKYGLHCTYYDVNKKNKRNKVTNHHYNEIFIEDWVKVGKYDHKTDVITFIKKDKR